MEFVYNDLGYVKEHELHATAYLDEETPYHHCEFVSLVKSLIKELILKYISYLRNNILEVIYIYPNYKINIIKD